MLKCFYDWRPIIVVFPTIFLYCGMIPLLKVFKVVKISWLWALCPIWCPFAAYWMIAGFIAFLAVIAEIGFIVLPDKDYMV